MDNKLMVSILKLRKDLWELYKKHSTVTGMLAKGIAALLLFISINSIFGDAAGTRLMFCFVAAVVCAVLPMRFTYLGSVAFIAVNLWQVSWDVMIFYLAAVLLSYLLICRVKPDTSIIIAFAPLFFYFKVPFLLPVLVGCFSSLFGVAAMVFGVGFYFICVYGKEVMPLLSSATGGDSVIAVKSMMDSLVGDQELFLLVGAFIVSAVITYLLYHQAFDHAWYVGITAGGLTGLVVYLAGGILFDIELKGMTYLFTVPMAVIIACAVQFFRCVIDYTGVERLEFQDDEYYYYVKAVPKINVIVEDFAEAGDRKERQTKKDETDDEK